MLTATAILNPARLSNVYWPLPRVWRVCMECAIFATLSPPPGRVSNTHTEKILDQESPFKNAELDSDTINISCLTSGTAAPVSFMVQFMNHLLCEAFLTFKRAHPAASLFPFDFVTHLLPLNSNLRPRAWMMFGE